MSWHEELLSTAKTHNDHHVNRFQVDAVRRHRALEEDSENLEKSFQNQYKQFHIEEARRAEARARAAAKKSKKRSILKGVATAALSAALPGIGSALGAGLSSVAAGSSALAPLASGALKVGSFLGASSPVAHAIGGATSALGGLKADGGGIGINPEASAPGFLSSAPSNSISSLLKGESSYRSLPGMELFKDMPEKNGGSFLGDILQKGAEGAMAYGSEIFSQKRDHILESGRRHLLGLDTDRKSIADDLERQRSMKAAMQAQLDKENREFARKVQFHGLDHEGKKELYGLSHEGKKELYGLSHEGKKELQATEHAHQRRLAAKGEALKRAEANLKRNSYRTKSDLQREKDLSAIAENINATKDMEKVVNRIITNLRSKNAEAMLARWNIDGHFAGGKGGDLLGSVNKLAGTVTRKLIHKDQIPGYQEFYDDMVLLSSKGVDTALMTSEDLPRTNEGMASARAQVLPDQNMSTAAYRKNLINFLGGMEKYRRNKERIINDFGRGDFLNDS
jgi:hypothetical protein